MDAKVKLVTSRNLELFERQLNEVLAGLARDDVIVDIKFSTSPYSGGVEYSALVHYQTTDEWQD